MIKLNSLTRDERPLFAVWSLVILPLGVPKCPGMIMLTGLFFFKASLGYQPPLFFTLEEELGVPICGGV